MGKMKNRKHIPYFKAVERMMGLVWNILNLRCL